MTDNTQNPLLRPITVEDTDAIYTILSDPSARLPFGLFSEPHFNKNSVTGWCGAVAAFNQTSAGLDKFYAIETDQKVIGYFGAGPDTDEPDRLDRWEIGYFLDAAYRGQSIVPRILSNFIQEARQKTLAETFFAAVKPDNRASQRVLEKAGFAKTGVDEKWMPMIIKKNGSYRHVPPAQNMDIYELRLTR